MPPVSTIHPVGIGVPLTATVTDSPWAVVMLDGEGVTVTAGAVGVVTVAVFDPVELV
jgi:hypothetical protein